MKGIISNGRRIDFSWTWYENMKKVIEIVEKPTTRLFLEGFITRDSIEGMLRVQLERKQSPTRVALLK